MKSVGVETALETSEQATSPVKTQEVPQTTIDTGKRESRDNSPAVGDTQDNIAAVVESKTNKTEEKPKTVDRPKKPYTPQPMTPKPEPLMASYGIGNVNPTVPEHYLKTFNARAPVDQIYPNTLDRNNRIKAFENEINRPSPDTSKLVNPSDILKQYLEAKRLVDKLSQRYKTEYHRSYLNWSKPIADKPERSGPAGIPSGYQHERKPRVHHKELVPQPSVETKTHVSVVNPLQAPVDYVQVQNIYQSLRPAGFQTQSQDSLGKKHFESVQTMKDQSFAVPQTFNLATDILERAVSRLGNQE